MRLVSYGLTNTQGGYNHLLKTLLHIAAIGRGEEVTSATG